MMKPTLLSLVPVVLASEDASRMKCKILIEFRIIGPWSMNPVLMSILNRSNTRLVYGNSCSIVI